MNAEHGASMGTLATAPKTRNGMVDRSAVIAMDLDIQRANMRKRLIVALDVPSKEEALALVDELGDHVTFYKIGLQLLTIGGIEIAEALKDKKKNVFLDYKLFDIGFTVFNAMTSIRAHSPVEFVTVQGDREIIENAVRAVKGGDIGILAVTVPTSWSSEYLREMDITTSLEDLVLRRAEMAFKAGCRGVIASAREASKIRALLGPAITIVTPGIRMPGSPLDDQVRTASPEEAVRAGADYLVVGRPITQSKEPTISADAIVDSMLAGSR